MIKFNPGLSQILSKVFFSKNSHVTQTFKILLTPYSEIPWADGPGGDEGGCSPPKFWATQIFWAARENFVKDSF